MSWNNVLPAWLVFDLCSVCGVELEVSRVEKPGQIGGCPKCKPETEENCLICGRLLNQARDPLSLDCGGDCLGCINEIEEDIKGDDVADV